MNLFSLMSLFVENDKKTGKLKMT